MKIGVVSDTHSFPLPAQMLQDFQKVDLIVHAGDFCTRDILEELKKLGEVRAVHGNMDGSSLRKLLPRSQIFAVGRFAVGLFHGEGPPATLLEKVRAEFQKSHVDVIIFGHSHQPMNAVRSGILFFNPGSATDQVTAPFCSYGILTVDENGIKGAIIKVKG